MKELSNADSIQCAFDFICNFPPNFIEETWRDDPNLQRHLTEKFSGFCTNDGFASPNTVVKFFFTLSSHNKKKLCEFIHNYYSQKQE
ncbi:MAG TPA: hypothetical protein PKW61_00080 [Tenuifilaceae bacterium]|nr:hypothetical protein [Tenuifilaceae bacterium]